MSSLVTFYQSTGKAERRALGDPQSTGRKVKDDDGSNFISRFGKMSFSFPLGGARANSHQGEQDVQHMRERKLQIKLLTLDVFLFSLVDLARANH